MTVSVAENIAVVSASGIVGAFLALAVVAVRAARELGEGRELAVNARLLAISASTFAGVTVAGVLVSPVAIDWTMAFYGAAGGVVLVVSSFAAGSGMTNALSRSADQQEAAGHGIYAPMTYAPMLSEQLKAAIARGLVIAVVSAVTTTSATWSRTDDSKTLLIVAATSFLATFLARTGLEGIYDAKRHRAGNVHPADVGAEPARVTAPQATA